jgi:hypothetical protein
LFNELTLSLHIFLLVMIYVFLFLVVKTIARDLVVTVSELHKDTTNHTGGSADYTSEFEKNDDDYPRIIHRISGKSTKETVYMIYDDVTIGRAADCDIVIDDNFVSSHHARVYPIGSHFWLEDLGSTNGTSVDGIRVVEPVRLANGDEITISENTFRFKE